MIKVDVKTATSEIVADNASEMLKEAEIALLSVYGSLLKEIGEEGAEFALVEVIAHFYSHRNEFCDMTTIKKVKKTNEKSADIIKRFLRGEEDE